MSTNAHGRDGCEWEPTADRPAYDSDEHSLETPAEIMVGAGAPWLLCASCAELPRFKRFRVRKAIVRREDAAA